jgi:hypothetical protein
MTEFIEDSDITITEKARTQRLYRMPTRGPPILAPLGRCATCLLMSLGFQKAPYAKSSERKDLGGLRSSRRSSASASYRPRELCARSRHWLGIAGRVEPAAL